MKVSIKKPPSPERIAQTVATLDALRYGTEVKGIKLWTALVSNANSGRPNATANVTRI